MTTDEPLPIVQENLVSLPSGNIYFMTTVISKGITITPEAFTDYKPLQDAQSLYRLGLNTNEPMYAFLSFWRSKIKYLNLYQLYDSLVAFLITYFIVILLK